jgi:Domain of unknown function (DUF4349)
MHLRRSSVVPAVLALVALAVSCARKGDSSGAASTATAEPPTGVPAKDPSNPASTGLSAGLSAAQLAAASHRKMIRNGVLDLYVERYEEAQQALEGLIGAAGGMIDSTNVTYGNGAVVRALLVIRVPSEGFSTLLPKLRQLGEVVHETTDAEDITAQYVDLGARRDTALALEKRLLELATNRAAEMSALLEVERELARVRGEIEQMEGQLRLWNDQVALSTLRLTIHARMPENPRKQSFLSDVADAMEGSVHALRDAMKALVLMLASLLPWSPVLVPIAWWIIRRWRRPAVTPKSAPPKTP